jgi:hypothetical protein
MTRKKLPHLASLKTISERLPLIFPEGIAHRNYLTREIAAKTIFVMVYVGAVEGTDRWLRPDQVTKMTDTQAVARDHKLARSIGLDIKTGRNLPDIILVDKLK